MTEHWDKESVYDNEISPLMTQIIAICKKHEMPIVCSVQYCDTEEDGPGFCTTTITNFAHACEKMQELNRAHQPRRAVAIAETHVTNPDGSKTIHIARVS